MPDRVGAEAWKEQKFSREMIGTGGPSRKARPRPSDGCGCRPDATRHPTRSRRPAPAGSPWTGARCRRWRHLAARSRLAGGVAGAEADRAPRQGDRRQGRLQPSGREDHGKEPLTYSVPERGSWRKRSRLTFAVETLRMGPNTGRSGSVGSTAASTKRDYAEKPHRRWRRHSRFPHADP